MSADNVMVRPNEALVEGSACPPAEAAGDLALPVAGAEPAELPLLLSPPIAGTREPGRTAARPAPRSGIELRIHHDLDEIGAEWRSFERHADHTAFQSFDWLTHWQRHVGAARGTLPAIVVGHELDGEILFILQFAIETLGPIRRLTWLGSQLCDYNAPLLAGHFSARVSAERFFLAWREVIELLRSHRHSRFDLIDLQKMPECVGEQRNPFIDLNVRPHPSGAYVAALGRNWEELYAAKRSGPTRKRERRQLRQLAEHGTVRFIDVEDADDRARTLTTLFEQKSRALARMGVDNLFLKPGRREFFLGLASDPALRRLVHISRLDVGARTAAAAVGLKFRNCYYLILSSYEDGELARCGPGRAHLHELLRHATEQGYAHFDFTVGDEPYKRDWSDTELKLYDYLQAGSGRGELFGAMLAQFRRVKRLIKQSPALWRAFSKGRALAASLTASRP
jgi:CelD/BcsL family acetyltransferase involved in cellulose biosynthesis